jgi:hypothetical protein
MWRRGLAVAAVFALVLLLGSGPALAQQQAGNVYGVVSDDQGSRLPGVTVTLTGGGAPRVQVTDAQGHFRFLGLQPGRYSLTAQLEGFSAVDFPNVQVNIGRNTDLEVTMNAAVEETITVTAESPLLDERKIAAGTTVSQIELEKIPTARDPWSILTQSAGVVSDRINVGGNESGQQAVFGVGGQSSAENTFAVDGVVITDMAAVGSSPTYYDFDQFEEMQVSTGGSDITAITGGVTMNLVTKRGTNEPRGSARYFLTDSDKMLGLFEEADPDFADELAPGQTRLQSGNRINEILDYGFEAGGPIVQDRLWMWGSYGRNDIKQFVATGAADNTLLENFALKLNGQLATNNSAVGSFNRGDKIKTGRNAGPTRPPETTWNQTGPTELWKAEDTHIFSSSLYVTGLFSYVDGGFALDSVGSTEAVWDQTGVWRNSYFSGGDDRNTTNYQVDGSYFFSTGNLDHELKFGTSFREFEQSGVFAPKGGRSVVNIAFENWGDPADVPGNVEVLEATRQGEAPVISEYTALWLQDTLTMGNLTFTGGLRYDKQEGKNEAAPVSAHPLPEIATILPGLNFPGNEAGFEWETISPRLGVTYALGEQRQTLLRASYARFAEQLQSGDISRLNPVGTAYAYFYFTDANGNFVYDAGDTLGDLVDWRGFDPDNPTSISVPNRNDPNLEPQLTDELIVGVEHALLPELVVGVQGTYRQITDILGTRLLKADGSFITRNDYVFSRNITGTLPDGSSFSVPFFELTPQANAARTGGRLLTNTGLEREYSGVNLNFTKRLSNRWMARGYVNWAEATWNIDDGDLFFDDPTDTLGGQTADTVGADNDGDVYAEQSAGSGAKGDVYLQSTWSANLNGMYQVAPDRPWGFNLAANLFAREGNPLPYFVNASGLGGSKNVQVSGFDQFRTDDIFTVDLRLEKDLAFADNLGATISIDAFNVLNENYVLQRERQLNGARANFLDETLSPRIYRLGFRLNWR